MMKPNTSSERVDALFVLDAIVTPPLYDTVRGEYRHRRMLRQGINLVAEGMRNNNEEETGRELQSYLHEQLGRTGITAVYFQDWPHYQEHLITLPEPPQQIERALDTLGNQYGDIERSTLNMLDEPERNSAHAIHLATLALPYAAEYYPELSQSKIALYCWVHDILESITGDVSSLGLDEAGFAAKEAAEHIALQQFTQEHQKRYPEFTQLVVNYEARNDPESAFVKSFDKLDPGFTHIANEGKQLIGYHGLQTVEAFKKMIARNDAKMQSYAQPFPLVLEDRQEQMQRIIDAIY
jgi:5'-deoxynucleotidase YfbR-like HD superfamily hydrolase